MIAAAGSGERLGAGGPKAFVELAGRPLLAWSLDAFAAAESIGAAVVAAPPGQEERAAEISAGTELEVAVIPGGEVRAESVARAVTAAETELVAIHDAARPLVSPELIDAIVARLDADEDIGGVVAAIPATDTLKEASVSRRVVRTLDRSRVWAVQTPQAFRAAVLLNAVADADQSDLHDATDDAILIERAGGDILLHRSSPENLKVTTALDLRLAELLLGEQR